MRQPSVTITRFCCLYAQVMLLVFVVLGIIGASAAESASASIPHGACKFGVFGLVKTSFLVRAYCNIVILFCYNLMPLLLDICTPFVILVAQGIFLKFVITAENSCVICYT